MQNLYIGYTSIFAMKLLKHYPHDILLLNAAFAIAHSTYKVFEIEFHLKRSALEFSSELPYFQLL